MSSKCGVAQEVDPAEIPSVSGRADFDHSLRVDLQRALRSGEGTHARPADHIDRNTPFAQRPDDADVQVTSRAAATEHDADRTAGGGPGKTVIVPGAVTPDVMMPGELTRTDPVRRARRLTAALAMHEHQLHRRRPCAGRRPR
jgi:hypothetical protein